MDSTQLTFEEKMNSYNNAINISAYKNNLGEEIINIDQSHYYKKWPEKSTKDFKKLIKAIIYHIEKEQLFDDTKGMEGR